MHIPGVNRTGGFTITSTSREAAIRPEDSAAGNDVGEEGPYFELAVREAPSSPPAAWLWREESEILGQELHVRVGGSFIWPPKGDQAWKQVVMIAGGMGIK